MTANSDPPTQHAERLLERLRAHRQKVARVAEVVADSPWQLGKHRSALLSLGEQEEQLAAELGFTLLRTVSLDTLGAILDVAGRSTEGDLMRLIAAEDAADAQRPSPSSSIPTIDEAQRPSPSSSIRTIEIDRSKDPASHKSPPLNAREENIRDSSASTPPGGDTSADQSPSEPRDTQIDEVDAAVLTGDTLEARMEELRASWRGESGDATSAEPTTRQHFRALRSTLKTLGLPSEPPTSIDEITHERDKLRKLFDDALFGILAAVPSDVNFAFTGWLVTRLKSFQDTISGHSLWTAASDATREWFHRLASHSKVTQPGHIVAFRADSTPTGATWFEDAHEWETKARNLLHDSGADESEPDKPNQTELIRSLIEESRRPSLHESKIRKLLKTYLKAGYDPMHTRFIRAVLTVSQLLDPESTSSVDTTLLRAIERYTKSLEEDDDRSPQTTLPEAWPGYALTRGKRMLMLGGRPSREVEQRLESAFQCESFEWVAITSGNRNADSVVERIKNGSVDVVIVQLQFVSHSVSGAVFAAGSEKVRVVGAWTYGVRGLATVIEDHLPNTDTHA